LSPSKAFIGDPYFSRLEAGFPIRSASGTTGLGTGGRLMQIRFTNQNNFDQSQLKYFAGTLCLLQQKPGNEKGRTSLSALSVSEVLI